MSETTAEQIFPEQSKAAEHLYSEHRAFSSELDAAEQRYEDALTKYAEDERLAEVYAEQGIETIQVPRFRSPIGHTEQYAIRGYKNDHEQNIEDARKHYDENEGAYKLLAAGDASRAGIQLDGVYGQMQKGLEVMGDKTSEQTVSTEK